MDEYNALLARLKVALPQLREQRDQTNEQFGAPDLFYRFYHQSFKVYYIQGYAREWTKIFQELGEGMELNSWYLQIISEGTQKTFDTDHNKNWLHHTRPLLEAYFHARMFLDQMIWCAENMETADNILPSPWAAVLYLYNMR